MRLIARLRQRARELKTEVVALWLAARHPRTPWYAKAFLVAIVAYALSPIDLIPDFIPVLGFVDEIILLPFAIVLAVKMVPADVMTECRGRAARESPASWMGRLGAAFVVLLWLALVAFVAIWAHRAFALPGSAAALPCSVWCADAQCASRTRCSSGDPYAFVRERAFARGIIAAGGTRQSVMSQLKKGEHYD